MSDSKTYSASFPIARMERRTSSKGTEYFAGFLGGARITLLKSTETGRDGCEIWHLLMAEGKLFPAKTASSEPQTTNGRPERIPQAASSRVKQDYARPADTAARGRGVHLSAEAQEIPF